MSRNAEKRSASPTRTFETVADEGLIPNQVQSAYKSFMADQQHVFSDVSTKKNPWTEDRLGYRPFAQRLANAIVQMDAPNGYVIGLHGSWGSGKSTAVNFVKAFLNKHNEELDDLNRRIHIVDFKPWMGSGQVDLVPSFFKVLSESISDRAIVRRRWLGRVLRLGKAGADPLVDAAATMAVAADPSLGIGSKVAAGATKKSLAAAIDRWLEEPSLQAAYKDLFDRLKSKGDKFLVVIDDIDRLTQAEVRLMMQMVKTVGQLPNVIYLLAYDRSVVWSALDERSSQPRDEGEPNFAEKIIQHEVELPRPGRSSLLRILDGEIGSITADIPQSARWLTLVHHGIFRWIRFPRDVARFANAINFAWPSLAGELDPQDFLCMEGLRIFDATLFEWIRDNRDLLLAEGQFTLSRDEEKSATVERLKERLSAGSVEDALELLGSLFPNHAKLWKGRSGWIGGEPQFETVRRRGISTRQGFNAYFQLQLAADEVSKRTVDDAISRQEDQFYQERVLRQHIVALDSEGIPLIRDYLRELRCRFLGDGAATPDVGLLNALFAVGDEIYQLERGSGMFEFPPHVEASYLVKEMLRRWGPARAAEVLIDAFASAPSLAMCADIFCDRARDLGKMPGNDRESDIIITEDELSVLGHVLLPRFRDAAERGLLSGAPFFYDILRAWQFAAASDEAKIWASENAQMSAVFLAKLAIGTLSYSAGESGRVYTLRERPDPTLYDYAALRAAAEKHKHADGLSADFASRIEALRFGLERLAARKNGDSNSEEASAE